MFPRCWDVSLFSLKSAYGNPQSLWALASQGSSSMPPCEAASGCQTFRVSGMSCWIDSPSPPLPFSLPGKPSIELWAWFPRRALGITLPPPPSLSSWSSSSQKKSFVWKALHCVFAVVQFRIVRSWTEMLQRRGTKTGRPPLVSQLLRLLETQGSLPFLETTPMSIAAICRCSLCARHGAACFMHSLLFNIYIIRLESSRFLFFI